MKHTIARRSTLFTLCCTAFIGSPSLAQSNPGRTVLRFPTDRSLGVVEHRIVAWGQSAARSPVWYPLGPAQGTVRIPPQADVRLRLDAQAVEDLSWLRGFKRNYLQAIRAAGTPLKDADLEHFRNLFALMYLDLSRTQITDKGLAILAKSLAIRDLNLRGTHVSDNGMTWAAKIRGLERLALPASIGDKGLSHLSELESLRALLLKNNEKITDAGLAILATFPKLSELDLTNTRLGDAALVHVSRIKTLRYLSLHGTKITDAGMTHLKALRGLYELKLSQTAISDQGLQSLTGMIMLETLLLGGTRITDEGLAHIGKLRSLRTLSLASTRIGDAGLEHLTALASIEKIYLNGTRVSDACVQTLARLPTLRLINLRDTQVSDAARARLRKALPDCTIIK